MKEKLIVMLFALVALAGCSLLPIPFPDPTPAVPYDCDNPPAATGIVPSLDPVPDCFVGFGESVGPSVASLSIGAFVFRGNRAAAAELLGVAGVSVLYECSRITVSEPGVSPAGVVWGLDRIGQRDLPLDGSFSPQRTGAGVKVGVNDTGQPYQLSGWRNVGPCLTAVGQCKDDHDHGSHVGGTAAHERFGVAPDAEIAWCKSLLNGSGSTADVIECIDEITRWCDGAPCIGNMSLGGPADDALDRAVCASRDAGVLWVVAAGNSSEDACRHSPARGTGAITVGATDERDRAAGFTNGGGCVDISAPGVAITSVGKRGEILTWDGTSMASPHVAGIAALCAEEVGGDPKTIRDCVIGQATLGRLSGLMPSTPNSLAFTPSGDRSE